MTSGAACPPRCEMSVSEKRKKQGKIKIPFLPIRFHFLISDVVTSATKCQGSAARKMVGADYRSCIFKRPAKRRVVIRLIWQASDSRSRLFFFFFYALIWPCPNHVQTEHGCQLNKPLTSTILSAYYFENKNLNQIPNLKMILNVEPTCTRARARAHTQALLGKKNITYTKQKQKQKRFNKNLKARTVNHPLYLLNY